MREGGFTGIGEARVWLIRTHFFNLTSTVVRATRADKGTTAATTSERAEFDLMKEITWMEVVVVDSGVNKDMNEGCCQTICALLLNHFQ